MKKILSLFAIFSLMYIVSPATASPPPPPGGGHALHAGPAFHRRMPPQRRHIAPPPAFIGIGYGRRGCYPYRYRMCWYDGLYRPCYDNGMYINFSVPIRF